MSDKIIVALDKMKEADALELARKLQGKVWGYKVNDQLISSGAKIITELKRYGKVFADPKLYDIPNTVGNAVEVIAAAGADLITVHVSGGRAMLREAVKKSGSAKILGMTILTSMDAEVVQEVYRRTTEEAVSHFASMALDAGAYGLICSPQDLNLLSKNPANAKLAKVTPGVRPSWYGAQDDQVRVSTPKEAIADGATLLVIGRPITGADDPLEAVHKINAELA